MSSLAFAPFDNDDDAPKNKICEKKSSRKNKTLKKQLKNTNVDALISEIHSQPDEYSDNGMSDFTPHSNPTSAAIERKDAPSVKNSQDETETTLQDEDSPCTPEAFNNIESKHAEDYYRAHVPYYTQMSEGPIANKDELMKKMEKILYLLEAQQDEKTGHVTEELILYSFLGVFIIFIVDSFARAGKYVR